MDRINIIMATYQGEEYIKEQIESLLRSEGLNYFISVYDDGSKDHTVDFVKEYVRKYPDKIELIQNEKNYGHCLNFLHGVVDNSYDYVMFCDQDDVWKVDKISKTYAFMKQMEKKQQKEIPMIVFTDAIIVDENLKEVKPSFHKAGGYDTSKLDLPHMLMENKMMGCTMMINRALINKVKRLPQHARFHDWWLALIAASYGKIAYLPEGTLYYRQHGNNVVGDVSYVSYVKSRIKDLKQQKVAIAATIAQAKEFYQMYGDTLPKHAKRTVEYFLELETANWWKRRMLVMKYGFKKSGFTRNLGLLIIL